MFKIKVVRAYRGIDSSASTIPQTEFSEPCPCCIAYTVRNAVGQRFIRATLALGEDPSWAHNQRYKVTKLTDIHLLKESPV